MSQEVKCPRCSVQRRYLHAPQLLGELDGCQVFRCIVEKACGLVFALPNGLPVFLFDCAALSREEALLLIGPRIEEAKRGDTRMREAFARAAAPAVRSGSHGVIEAPRGSAGGEVRP
jgi:hypothetical protein